MKICMLFLLFLAQFAYCDMTRFPVGKCNPQGCEEMPLQVSFVNETCFRFDLKPCGGYCCDYLTQNVQKVLLNVNPLCKSDFRYVTINNIRKPGGVFFDLYDNNNLGEIRITSLLTNAYDISGSVFCIIFDANTECARNFAYRYMSDRMTYSIYDPFDHMCCPVCYTSPQVGQTPPSPPPPPPPIVTSPPPSPPPPPPPIVKSPPPSPPPPPPPIVKSPPPPPLPPSQNLNIILFVPFVYTMDCNTIDAIYLDNKISISKSCRNVYTSSTGKYYQTGVIGDDRSIRFTMYDMVNQFPCTSTLSLEEAFKNNSLLRLKSYHC